MAYDIIYLSPADIKPYRKNAKKHPPEQVDKIAESIKQFGFRQNLVVDENNVLVIGHGRWLAARKLGLERVPCMKVYDLSEEQLKALRLADNRVAESEWDDDILKIELDDITDLNMADFGFTEPEEKEKPDVRASLQHGVFENQEVMQFPEENFFGIPSIKATQTSGSNFLRFCDYSDVKNHGDYICHFFYDDFKFMSLWREPEKHVKRLRNFRAVVAPDFSLYTDFPRALQILACYRRQWCAAYWQSLGIDVIPDVIWGDKKSFDYCFLGLPKHSVVAVSSVGVSNDFEWNGKEGDRFKEGYNEMLQRLEPTKILFYGAMPSGLQGDIIRIPSFYEEKRARLNEMRKKKLEILS